MDTLDVVNSELDGLADPDRAINLMRFFKTGPGHYGEGDQFLGLTVPMVRRVVKTHWKEMSLAECEELLHSKWHEKRLAALLFLVQKFKRDPKRVYEIYLRNTEYINNWDLVDASADKIVGAYLYDRDKKPLLLLTKSEDLWKRRISIIATFHYIKRNEFDVSLQIADILMYDRRDLINKAVGWMLREIGKRDVSVLVAFLATRYKTMPRTMLRYAIERFDVDTRKAYLKGTI